MSQFKREQTEPFSKAVARFDSLYSHLSELKAPIYKNELSSLSLQTLKLVTPYLLSNGAAKIYGDWLQSELSLNREVTRDRIVQCVIHLENNDKFKLDRDRGIPHHLAATQLGILDAVPDPIIPAFLAQGLPPVTPSSTNPARQRSLSGGSACPSRHDQPARGQSARPGSQNSRPGSKTFSRPGSANSVRSNNSAYSRPGSKSRESSTDNLKEVFTVPLKLFSLL